MIDSFMFLMDVIGTVAFAISGAMAAICKEMDIFGVNILAMTTATGGGILRDILIGRIPPLMFRTPIYAMTALATANVVFVVLYIRKKRGREARAGAYERILFWIDTLGLAAFTVEGTIAGAGALGGTGLFLMSFAGVITGVGGGVMRDVMAQELPSIFVKRIYACAALAGAVTVAILSYYIDQKQAMIIGFVLIIVIRCLAAHFRWNLPRITQ